MFFRLLGAFFVLRSRCFFCFLFSVLESFFLVVRSRVFFSSSFVLEALGRGVGLCRGRGPCVAGRGVGLARGWKKNRFLRRQFGVFPRFSQKRWLGLRLAFRQVHYRIFGGRAGRHGSPKRPKRPRRPRNRRCAARRVSATAGRTSSRRASVLACSSAPNRRRGSAAGRWSACTRSPTSS